MKTVYICGDSFAATDPEYGTMWAELLARQLGPTYTVVNTSSVAASNTLVAIQVDSAIRKGADYIIMLATACTRSEVLVKPATEQDLLARFDSKELVSYSIFRPYRSALPEADQATIRDFHARYGDLELNIFRDYSILLGTLYRLHQSGIPFCFDQGGFEHPSFGGRTGYFAEFDQYRTTINLWDLGTTVDERPYYHIKEPATHQMISSYYTNLITHALN